ncbi:alpha/beta hydrolase [Actinomarinicola tropica]|uniref:Alpha/beta hydrolase fold domain-containing protein n=1 Tax=Actinomarinicola tropica TaxID=2789776 RepID=A0A5Q2RGU7_9ACTN|nr:alpha/beta hydrolase [Actinomarinicola tropica]QGG93751.1 alpha/beta hydrolase fold domain-containing protein [Actinomarinicola tropica]
MPVDPQTQAILDLVNAAAAEPVERTPATSREAYRGLAATLPPGPDVAAEDRTIPGPAGEVPVRVYRPEGDGPFPALVFLHGGGWTIGDLETHDHPARTLCAEAGVVVVSVDYRLAPEHPFPAAFDDAWAALRWVADHGADIGVDPTRLAVGGDSAGGNLAAVLALRAREEGGPALRFQLLVYPAVDMRRGTEEHYPSLRENAEGYLLTFDTMQWFGDNYLGDDLDRTDWRVSPLLAADHSGLPPALVITAEFDPLRDEGAAYVEALHDAGVPVTHTLYEGTIHTMYQLAPFIPAGAEALSESAEALRAALFDA